MGNFGANPDRDIVIGGSGPPRPEMVDARGWIRQNQFRKGRTYVEVVVGGLSLNLGSAGHIVFLFECKRVELLKFASHEEKGKKKS